MRVDLDRIIESKNPKLHRRLPRFVVSWMKRLIHQNQLNECLERYADLPPVEFAASSLDFIGISYRSQGLDTIDPQGRYIFASNHPFGGADGLMLAVEVARHFGDARLVVNDLLMNLLPLRAIFVPVNKHGRQNQSSVNEFNDALSSNVPIITFPAGLCSRDIDGKVQDAPWKSNFVKRGVSSQRDVVPVFFDGKLSKRFYIISKVRKMLGIKANIEMFTLVDELFAQRGNNLTIRFGEPVKWQQLQGMSPKEATEYIRIKTYNLGNR